MEGEEAYGAVLDALIEHDKRKAYDAPRLSPGMIAITPFDAETDDGNEVRVVGIVTNPGADVLDFIVIKTREDGEIVAASTSESSLWIPKQEPT